VDPGVNRKKGRPTGESGENLVLPINESFHFRGTNTLKNFSRRITPGGNTGSLPWDAVVRIRTRQKGRTLFR